MKQKILLVSFGAAGLATLLGILGIYSETMADGEIETIKSFVSTAHYFQLAGVSGLFSISSFFVGLAYPASVTHVTEYSDGTNKGIETRKIVNN